MRASHLTVLPAVLLGLALAACPKTTSSDDDDSASTGTDAAVLDAALPPADAGTADAATPLTDAGTGDGALPPDAAVVAADAGTPDAANPLDGGTCNLADPGDPDRPRIILVSHGYTTEGANTGHDIRSLSLPATGVPVSNGVLLDVGVRVKRLAFVPSGAFALALGEDGDLVSVKINAVDDMVVVDRVALPSAGFEDLVVAPDGRTVYAVGSNVAETSGISTVTLDCTGHLTVDTAAFFNLRLTESLVLIPGTNRAVLLGGQAVFDPVDDNDLRLLEHTAAGWQELGAFNIYTDMISTGRMGLSPDGTLLLVPNGSPFSDQGNQVAVVRVDGDSLTEVQRLTAIAGPSEALFSPDGTTALLSQPESNALLPLTRTDGGLVPGTAIHGVGLGDQMVQVTRGSLAGLVLVASTDTNGMSNLARVRFTAPGVVQDQGQTNLGDGMEDIPDAVAVMP